MTTDRLERAAERFADTVQDAIEAKVREAWLMERERWDAELAELKRQVRTHSTILANALDAEGREHSRRVDE